MKTKITALKTFICNEFRTNFVFVKVETALWDIKGKALGVPVYPLLGGKVRDAVPVYVNGWFAPVKTPDGFAEKAMVIPGRPGLGIELNGAELLKHPYIRTGLRHCKGTLTNIRPPSGITGRNSRMPAEKPAFFASAV